MSRSRRSPRPSAGEAGPFKPVAMPAIKVSEFREPRQRVER